MLTITEINNNDITVGNIYDGETSDIFTVTKSNCYSNPVVGDWVIKYTSTIVVDGVEQKSTRISKVNHLDQPYTNDELAQFIKQYNALLNKQSVIVDGSCCVINPWEYYSTATHVIEIDEELLNEHTSAVRGLMMSRPSLVTFCYNCTNSVTGKKCVIYNIRGNDIYKSKTNILNQYTITEDDYTNGRAVGTAHTAIGYICARPKVQVQLSTDGRYVNIKELFIFSGCETTLGRSALPISSIEGSNLESLVLLGDNVVNLTTDFFEHWDDVLTNPKRKIYVEDKMYDSYVLKYGISRNFIKLSNYGVTENSWLNAFQSAVSNPCCTQLTGSILNNSESFVEVAGTPTKVTEITSGEILTSYNTITQTTQTKVVSTLAYVHNSELYKQLTNEQWEKETNYAVPFVEVIAPLSAYNIMFTNNSSDNAIVGACHLTNTDVCAYRPIFTDRGYSYFKNFVDYASEINMQATIARQTEDMLDSVDSATMIRTNQADKVVCQFIIDGVQYKVTGDLFMFNINNYEQIQALLT